MATSDLRLEDTLPAILVLHLQGAGSAFRLQYHVRVFGARRPGEAQPGRLLRGVDLDRRPAALGDQPEQHGQDQRLGGGGRSEEHTSEVQSPYEIVWRL